MAKLKKTVSVIELIIWANGQLARNDEFADQKFKAGICTAIEQILFKSGNYKGFGFLYVDESTTCISPHHYSRFYY